MEVFLEILKYTLPGLLVFLASYFILRKLVDSRYHLQALELKAKYSKDAIPLKLQAYERLILFCDRIDVPNLIMRLNSRDMSSAGLKSAMMISVQKEYEHNIAQQLYISNKLWQIISLAKNDVISFIEMNTQGFAADDRSEELARKLLNEYGKLERSPINIAISAIKEESKYLLDV